MTLANHLCTPAITDVQQGSSFRQVIMAAFGFSSGPAMLQQTPNVVAHASNTCQRHVVRLSNDRCVNLTVILHMWPEQNGLALPLYTQGGFQQRLVKAGCCVQHAVHEGNCLSQSLQIRGKGKGLDHLSSSHSCCLSIHPKPGKKSVRYSLCVSCTY